jgi:hypothetical protein
MMDTTAPTVKTLLTPRGTTMGNRGRDERRDDRLADQIARLAEAVVRLETKLDGYADHETRIRALEKWRYSIPAAVLIAVGGLLTELFTHTH